MRKAILPFIALLVANLCHGQIQKGDVLIGGSFQIITSTFEDSRNTGFSLAPRAGFFLSDRTSLGPILGYSYTSRKDNTIGVESDYNTNTFTFGAYMRNYKPISEKFFFFLQSGIVYGTGNVALTSTTFDEEGDQTLFEVSVSPGLAYFVNDRISLDVRLATVTFRDEKTDVLGRFGGIIDSSGLTISGGLTNVSFGLSWFLR